MTILALALAAQLCAAAPKESSSFFPKPLIARAQANVAKYPWAKQQRDRIVAAAEPYRKMTDDQLWDLVFGPHITRSHMVWSAGFCPACRKPMPMYDWKIDAFADPWKARCPHCNQKFPTNDFEKYHRSGYDEHGIFDPNRADRKLLFNVAHPNPSDPLHKFGVDDGEGYVEGNNRWRFIGAYLLYGHYTQLIERGLASLAAAYTVTGDAVYARKAGILLDRIADVFPTFDYAEQGLVYERAKYGGGVAGYFWYAITSAHTARTLAIAYDQIFDHIRGDRELTRFLAAKAARYRLDNRKATFADVQRNIEDGILRDVLAKPLKIRTNYPGTESTVAIIRTVLDWPDARNEVMPMLHGIVASSTAVDGLSGEKGLAGYSVIAPRFLGWFLELYGRIDPRLIPEMIAAHPALRNTYRFHAETWIGRQYYPNIGDSGAFATRNTTYAALQLAGQQEIDPPTSPHSYLWRLHKATNDPLFAQIMNLAPMTHDIFDADPAGVEEGMRAVIAKAGEWPKFGSVNYKDWKLAILRSPRNPDAAVWIDYDSVPECKLKSHYHFDAMNVGLVAKGLDLMPEFGYPAVQFGDWHTPQALWHKATAAHNTVVVDGKNQSGGPSEATLWEDGPDFRAVRASSASQYRGERYERTLAMIDIDDSDFYVVDVFRVKGGTDHAKFTHSAFAQATAIGLSLQPGPDYAFDTLTRNLRRDAAPSPGWGVDWKIDGSNVHLRYTDLTEQAEASLLETWTVKNATSVEQFWIPTVMTRRQSKEAPLESEFVSVMEPYQSTPHIRSIQRNAATLTITLTDGRRHSLSILGGSIWKLP
ncbi:MAG: heparinase II/III family protein [Acidobacteria bacterium]|nr:heparinase II/III family protein [Acidobacteriota bacterium]